MITLALGIIIGILLCLVLYFIDSKRPVLPTVQREVKKHTHKGAVLSKPVDVDAVLEILKKKQ